MAYFSEAELADTPPGAGPKLWAADVTGRFPLYTSLVAEKGAR
ncbi:hypothetical protein [Nocardia fluminea]|uniref:Uncharacterized protein n=1 Tax=Nocardia fluminea TaxID=134984 RepID=A0A2N3VK82_9NOCA|nr:hypothetical protein [Nocardia fluminea]PKV82029.1 hypothetical protein ATK86_6512 [Nocardia fluminea]